MFIETPCTDSAIAASPGALGRDAWRQLFSEARSNLNFADRDVPVALVREVFEHAVMGPTGNNSVPMRLAVAESDGARAAVIATATPPNRPRLERAPLLLVVARDDRYHDHLHVTAPGSEHIHARLEAAEEDRLMRAHDGAWLQAAYLILALRAAGLAVRPYGGFDRGALSESLLGGSHWTAEMLLGVGYPPDGDHGAGERRGRLGWDDAARVL